MSGKSEGEPKAMSPHAPCVVSEPDTTYYCTVGQDPGGLQVYPPSTLALFQTAGQQTAGQQDTHSNVSRLLRSVRAVTARERPWNPPFRSGGWGLPG